MDEIRIRKKIIELIYHAKAPHVGSALSCADILECIYRLVSVEKIKTNQPDRDYVILSKGHAIAAQLAVLNHHGIIDDQVFSDFCKSGTPFFENTSPYTPCIECASGSLGQGISFGVGAALGMKMNQFTNAKTYVVMGDGELNEGQCWEAFEQASCLELDNLIVFVDHNGLAGIGKTRMLNQISNKMQAFGFETFNVDGHDITQMQNILLSLLENKKPKALICETTKGKGISFMENDNNWHYRPISDADYEKALMELKDEKYT